MRRHEFEVFGFIVSSHPLDLYEKPADYVRAKDLPAMVGKPVTAIGWQITGKTVLTRNSEPMKFVSFEDPTGIYETVFFPKAYNRFCHMLNASRPYILKGRVDREFGALTLTVDWIGFLDRDKRQWALT